MAIASTTRAVVVDTSRSPNARLRPLAIDAVTLDDAFWSPRLRVNHAVTLAAQYRQCEETGRIDNFRRAAGTIDTPFQGRYFNDSDVYKWIEAAAWTLAAGPDPALERQVDDLIIEIAAAQRPDGYLNTYFARERAEERWTDFDLHEMYCAGHLFQAAVAHHRATGATSLLDVATRFADHICATFGPPETGKRLGADGHPEIELALVELYRETGERRYLEQAQFFLDVRGRGLLGPPYDRFRPAYHQDHQPFREQDAVVGHAVRAIYLTAGATDLAIETGEDAVVAALHRLWTDMTARKMYATGGIGARYEGEAFGDAYELPNARAYAETCAAIASVMWNWRLLLMEGEARYADVMELALYNGVLSGLSLAGDTYFYENPLTDDGTHRRQPWFGTACCPPNIARLLASLPGYVYTVASEAIWIHLYVEGTADVQLPDGRDLQIRQRTRYPWDGDVEIEVSGEGEFSVLVRIPAWGETGATVTINGQTVAATLVPGSYAEIRRDWQTGDVIHLSLPMPVRRIVTHPRVAENVDRVALMRGPLLYCLEAADNPGADPRDVSLSATATLTAEFQAGLLDGVVTISGEAVVASPDATWGDRLYRPIAADTVTPPGKRATVTAIPYFAWANREPGPMAVWLREA
jgi:DUF1680 family protein